MLRDRRFALLAFGQAVNAIGSWCALVALWGFASFRFDAGPSDLALLGLAWALPAVVLGPIAGVPVDRLGPKRVIVIADTLAAGVALLFLLADSFSALILLGAIGSFSVVHLISERDYPDRPWTATIPWVFVIAALSAAAILIFLQPMEMRGLGLAG